MGRRKRQSRAPGFGCGYLVMMATVTSLLIIINSWIVGRIVAANWSRVPDFFQDVRLFQVCQIFIPMILVMIQFVIYDRVRDAMTSAVSGHPDPQPSSEQKLR